MKFYIAQGIGFIGMALVFLAFQQNKKQNILWVQAAGGIAFAVHFLLLGAWTGAAMNFLEIPRNLVFAQVKKRRWLWTAIFVAAFAILGVLTWESPMSLFPICAMSLSTVAFSLQKPRHIRVCSVPVSVLWMTYNILSWSIAGVLTEGLCLFSIIIAIVRFDIIECRRTKSNGKCCRERAVEQ